MLFWRIRNVLITVVEHRIYKVYKYNTLWSYFYSVCFKISNKIDYIKETQCKMIGTILTIGSSLNICFACAYFYSEAFIFKGHCIKMFWYLSIHYKSSKRYNRLQVVNVKKSFAMSRSYITKKHNWWDCMRHTMKESRKYTILQSTISL